jgi:L-fucose mutarotase
LLWVLAAMGHGDRLAVVDANYPSYSVHERTVILASADVTSAIAAIATVFPVDTFVEPAVHHMTPDGDPGVLLPVHVEVGRCIDEADGRPHRMGGIERSRFYDIARGAFAAVATGDTRAYACFLLTKGVVA